MAKIIAPLLSLSAWGTIAKRITFRRHGRLVRALAIPLPTDAKTAIQRAQRLLFQDAVAWWHDLSTEERLVYDAPGRAHHMSGYAYFIKTYLLNPPAATFLSLTDTPDIYTGEAGHSPIVNPAGDALIWGTIKEYTSGIVDIPGQSRAKGYRVAVQGMGKILLDAKAFDQQNEFNTTTHRFTATEAGVYVGIGNLSILKFTAETGQVTVYIYRNGVEYSSASFYCPPPLGVWSSITNDLIPLSPGDYLELYAWWSMLGVVFVQGGVGRTFLSVGKLY